jgi:hypothetical protein
MESYEEKQSDALQELIFQNLDVDQLENVESHYKDILHPNIGYLLGVKWVILGYKESAFSNFVNSAAFGLTPDSPWLQTGYVHSIGQSAFHLIELYRYNSSFNDIKLKLVANAYICFSAIINSIGLQAYDSLKLRAWLLSYISKDSSILQFLNEYYYTGDDLCIEILTLSDYYHASQGYKSVGEQSNHIETLEDANRALEVIKSLPQYSNLKSLPIEAVVEISKQNHDFLFKKTLAAFLSKEFHIEASTFKSRIENERIIDKYGLWGG